MGELSAQRVYDTFCATHLPTLVTKFVHLPPATPAIREKMPFYEFENAYYWVLMNLKVSPYMTKFLLSKEPCGEPGKKLVKTLARRLLKLAPNLTMNLDNPTIAVLLPDILGTLEILILPFARSPEESTQLARLIPQSTRMELARWVEVWHANEVEPPEQCPMARDTSQSLPMLLTGVFDATITSMDAQDFWYCLGKTWRRHFECAWDPCKEISGLKDCARYAWQLSINLYLIDGWFRVRCRTLRYVGPFPTHQVQGLMLQLVFC
jgi:hypothetical protein